MQKVRLLRYHKIQRMLIVTFTRLFIVLAYLLTVCILRLLVVLFICIVDVEVHLCWLNGLIYVRSNVFTVNFTRL